MARKDLFHDEFKAALTEDGWTVTHDPFIVQLTEDRSGEIDLGAEKVIAAEKGTVKIAVEIKTFLGPSFVNDLHRAVGQFLNYKVAIRRSGDDRLLFLAVPEVIWQRDFQDDYLIEVVEESGLNIVTYDPANKEIIRWISK